MSPASPKIASTPCLIRRSGASGTGWYESPRLNRLDVPHAFSTRVGGVSRGPFAALNLGQPSMSDVKDDPAHVSANWERLLGDVGLPALRVTTHQVHGTEVATWSPDAPLAPETKADAIMTAQTGATLVQRTADCMPVLLALADGNRVVAVGAVHAGWRGLAAAEGGVIGAAIRHLRALAPDREEVVAAIGPCISAEAFEVGEEVAAVFEARWPGSVLRRAGWPRPHVDLVSVACEVLAAEGVGEIDAGRVCTAGNTDAFFSHRRDGVTTGRMAAVIALPEAAASGGRL